MAHSIWVICGKFNKGAIYKGADLCRKNTETVEETGGDINTPRPNAGKKSGDRSGDFSGFLSCLPVPLQGGRSLFPQYFWFPSNEPNWGPEDKVTY